MFLAALALSVLASKHPGNLGLLPLGDWHRRWVENPAPTRLSRNDHLARLGLKEEIEATERLRQLGRFMHEEFEPGVSLLTPWPGGTGYIWRLQTIDALGRTTCLPGETVPRPWSGLQRADVLRLFGLGADYIVPAISWSEKPPSPIELVDDWIVLVDDGPRDPARSAAAREILRAYELITLPVPIAPSATSRWPTRPFHLLRRRALDRAPKLEVALEDGRFRVSVRHGSHKQLVDLCVLLVDARGERWSMLPTGVVRPGATGMMRTSILVFGTGDRAIELATGAIPDDDAFVELRAVLRNPQARAEHPFALASVEVRRPIRR
jgi:hypothetical protein